jgi:hypothetical protein
MHGLVALFLGVIALAIILLVVGWSFLSPHHHVEGNPCVDCLDDDSQIADCCDRVSHFDDSCGSYDYNADGSLLHGYAQ